MNATAMLITSEAKMVIRDYAGLIVPIALPLLIMVTSAGPTVGITMENGYSAFEAVVVPVVFTIVVATAGIVNMPSFLASYRRTGVLRRLAVTPVSPLRVLGAQVAVNVIQCAIGIGIASGVAVMTFGLRSPANPLRAVAIVLLGLAATYAVGMVIAAIAPTPNSAVAIGLVVFLGFGALGGMFGGPGSLPEPLSTIGAYLPFGATTAALGQVWIGAELTMGPVIALAAWAVAGSTLAAATFRWNP